MNDTVYQISPDKKIIPKYHLGFHAQGEIADFYEKTKNFDRNKFSESKMELIWTFDFFELDDMFYINYSKSNINKVYISIIQKKDYKISHSLVFERNKEIFAHVPFTLLGYHQNSILGCFDGVMFDMLSKKNLEYVYPHLDEKGIRDINALMNTENNPVVVIIYLKKS